MSDELRGRVMSTYQLAAVGMTPLGALLVGFLGTRIGPRAAVTICGAVILACAVTLVMGLKSIGGAAQEQPA